MLADAPGGRDSLIEAIEEVDGTLISAEEKLIQMKRTGTGQDQIRWPTMVSGRIGYLIRNVATYDFPPNDQQREVQDMLETRMRDTLVEVRRAVEDVRSLNETLAGQGVPQVLIGTPQP